MEKAIPVTCYMPTEKIAKLKRPADNTVRAALVYDGSLALTVVADGYFDSVVTFAQLAGID